MKKTGYLRSRKSGLPPGSPIYIGLHKANDTRVNCFGYDQHNFMVAENADIKTCLEYKDKLPVCWIDIVGLHDLNIISSLCKSLGVHPLVIEDIFNTEQRPKIDIFEDYIFIIVRAYTYDEESSRYLSQQISMILGKNFVLTIRENSEDLFTPIKERLQTAQNILRKKGADYLVHALIDVVVDDYFYVVEALGDKIEKLEEEVTGNFSSSVVKDIHAVKREIIFLRKSVWPLREVISGLQHRIEGLIDKETILYLKDIYDHTIQVLDTIETYRDFLSSMLEVYLSSINNKLNEVMKVLTVFASIFIPLTFVTGLYGMNFHTDSPYNMPELSWRYGYLFFWGIVIAVVIIMSIFFKRKKWW